ncbi:hypothetical protein BBB57_11820 [Kosakonia sacchari]|nr:hypothetical protein BBB57_11820 [Kosakonia sacchari]
MSKFTKQFYNPKKYESMPLKDMLYLTRLRHVIVHRNGKTTDGTKHNFTSVYLDEAFETVNRFITHMKDLIS